ncbi:rcc01693 family protein [Frigidibacter sp. ROC022]|uniref:rcc01693 family protein n=1 Tax=Frigidibacter sp. ROC022 TaxID=2971796 RepID=UPI00215A3275|nr:rcc01693 family protein [Frigidibacter sp. ROC022]MCR8723631.1 phage tail assembly chaperone [Frigidibacter sp. ROC022]
MAGGGLDWPGLMRAGLRGLGLEPRVFWRLTPAELRLMLGEVAAPAMARARLEELAARWPDRKGQGDDGD